MKTTLTILTLLLSIHFTQAQTNVYQPYPLDNASWTIHTQLYDGQTYIQDWYSINWSGDTIVNGENYTRVFDNPSMIGVRQDIPNEKIFYINDQGVEFDASFDQSAMPGDTVLMTEAFEILSTFDPGFGIGDYTAIVESVDSILLGSTYHKTMYFSQAGALFSPTYICGVGFLSAMTSISSEFNIACYYVDGYQLIGSAFDPNCTAGIEELSEQGIRIYPNPTEDLFFIDVHGLMNIQEIHLLDLAGIRIISFDKNEAESGFDISKFPNGIYFVEVVFENRRTLSRLIKE